MCYNFIMNKNILNSGSNCLANLAIGLILGLTPLFFNYFYPTSIDLDKLVVFKIFTLLLLFAVVWHFSKFQIKISQGILKNVLPLGLLFIFLIISLLFSVDPAMSWLGTYDRQEGLISWLFYGLWATLLVLHLNSIPENLRLIKINSFLKVISISGLLVSFYAILQILGWDFVTWSEPANITGRSMSFFGQPNYLACWLVLVLPFSAYLIFIAKNKLSRLPWALVFISELAALLATGSRATFFIFLIISAVWLIWFLTQKNILSRQKIFLIILVVVITLSSFLTFLAISNRPRFEELTNFKKGSAAVRLELWQTGWAAYLKKPWLGYGLENQKEVYVTYYKVDSALYSKPNSYSDRAHNLILDILLTTGIVGLLFFAYFIYWVFANLLKALKDNNYQNLSAFLMWSLAVYLVSLLFNFSVTVTNIYFWFIVALAFVISGKSVLAIQLDKKIASLARTILVLATALLFLYGSFIEIERLQADYYYNKILDETVKSEYFAALVLKDYLNATGPNQVFADYYNQGISLRFLESLPNISNQSSTVTVLRYLALTEKILPSSNFENRFVKAFISGALGDRYNMEKSFNDLALLSPELPKIYLAWGDSLMFNHDYKNAIIKFEKAYSLLPDSNNPYLSLNQKNSLDIYKQQVMFRLAKAKLLAK